MDILVSHCHPKQVNLTVLLAHQICRSLLALGGAYRPVGMVSVVAAHPCVGGTERGAGSGSADEWGGWISATGSDGYARVDRNVFMGGEAILTSMLVFPVLEGKRNIMLYYVQGIHKGYYYIYFSFGREDIQ